MQSVLIKLLKPIAVQRLFAIFFFSSRRRHTRLPRDWSSDVCSSDLIGIHVAYVTLHVGLGTFRPVTVDNVVEHDMHAEYYEISEKTAERLNQVKAKGGRIFSVGTTVTRALEANMKKYDLYTAEKDWTNIFIYPPYKFKAIDGMLTNFHLPKSTLLMLVSAFASKELIFKAYKEAIQQNYRFFSFGDCMLILS